MFLDAVSDAHIEIIKSATNNVEKIKSNFKQTEVHSEEANCSR